MRAAHAIYTAVPDQMWMLADILLVSIIDANKKLAQRAGRLQMWHLQVWMVRCKCSSNSCVHFVQAQNEFANSLSLIRGEVAMMQCCIV